MRRHILNLLWVSCCGTGERRDIFQKSENQINELNKSKNIRGNVKEGLQMDRRYTGKATYNVSRGRVSMCNIIGNRLELSQEGKLNER